MALRGMTSAEDADATSIGRKWSIASGSIACPTTGLGGTGNVRLLVGAQMNRAVASAATYHFGFRFVWEGYHTRTLIVASVSQGGSIHLRLGVNSVGQLVIQNGGGATLWTGGTLLNAGQAYWLSWSCTIADSGGSTAVYVNGSPTADATAYSGDTKGSGSAAIDVFSFGLAGQGTSKYFRWQHWHANDTSGSAPNNTRWPDTRILAQLPVSDGHHVALTPSAGTDLFAMVDDATTDGDSTTLSGTGGRATFNFAALPITASEIYGVGVNIENRRTDATDRTIAAAVYQDATDYESAPAYPGTSFGVSEFIFETDPDTAAAWVQAGLEAAEFGALVA